MNITFMIGNGFDLNIGLKTRYKDFILEYLKIDTKDDMLKKFKKILIEMLICGQVRN